MIIKHRAGRVIYSEVYAIAYMSQRTSPRCAILYVYRKRNYLNAITPKLI